MIYLVVLVLFAAAGILRLWLQQRRERSHLDTVDSFRSSLERISAEPVRVHRPVRRQAAQERPRRRSPQRHQPQRHQPQQRQPQQRQPQQRVAVHARGRRNVTELDPARRAAAKRRIEARRRARSRAAV